jgi:hypothetical protein
MTTDISLEKTLPCNLEAERVTLGAILMDERALASLNGHLSADDFYLESHRRIFGKMRALAAASTPIDSVTLKNELQRSDELEAAGGVVYLEGLTTGVPRVVNVEHYAKIVKENATLRRLIQVSNETMARSYEAEEPAAEILTSAQNAIRVITDRNGDPRLPRNAPEFTQEAEDRYKLTLPDVGIVIEVDRLRREHHELMGELCVRCSLPGARTYDGTLSTGNFNLSSTRARTERARLLADQSKAPDLDWPTYLEEFCQRVLAAERIGQPAVDLRDLARPEPDDAITIEGLILPRRHPAFIFGDGGAAKSYTGLYLAGRMVEKGLAVALFDWELAGEDHRDRLERLFGKAMPRIVYARCEKPLVYEADRLRRIVREKEIAYAVFDSVAFACDGPPEAAEVAGAYFRAVRQIGAGSLHIAHVSKADGADQKPFGSVFWSNGARSTWYVKLADQSPDGRTLSVGFFNRKANLGRLHPPAGFKIAFTSDRTYFSKSDPADSPDLAIKMTIRERMIHLLRDGALPLERVAEETDTKLETIRRTANRYKTIFTVIEGGKVGLLQRVS